MYVGVSDHQLIFCSRKISRIKTGGAHKYLNFHSLKNYTADYYKEALKQVVLLKIMTNIESSKVAGVYRYTFW